MELINVKSYKDISINYNVWIFFSKLNSKNKKKLLLNKKNVDGHLWQWQVSTTLHLYARNIN